MSTEFDRDQVFADDDEDIVRYVGLYSGTVVTNKDPEGLCRVTVKVQGLLAESEWALPAGTAGGADGVGDSGIPPEGADVFVWFINGNLDEPIYFGGHWGRQERPPGPAGEIAPADRPKIRAFETGRYLIVMDGRESAPSLALLDKQTGARIAIDDADVLLSGFNITVAAEGSISMSAGAGIDAAADGPVDISGASVSIDATGQASIDGVQVRLGTAGPPNARLGDQVIGSIAPGLVHVTNPAGVPPTIPNPAPIPVIGVITTGSAKVTSE